MEPTTQCCVAVLPSEILDMILCYLVQHADINSLGRTCRRLLNICTPHLYKHVELRLPIHWSPLASVESLISYGDHNLQHCQSLSILPHQKPFRSSDQNESSVSDHNDDSHIFLLGIEDQRVTSALNAFVRMLIARILPNKLLKFHWEHYCIIDDATLKALARRHKGTLCSIVIGSSGNYSSPGLSEVHNLREMSVMNITQGADYSLLYKAFGNPQALRRLCLGFEHKIAGMYAVDGKFDEVDHNLRRYTQDIISCLNGACEHWELDRRYNGQQCPPYNSPSFTLDELYLCGLCFTGFVDPEIRPLIAFNDLKVLRLESCGMLDIAFPMLIENDRCDAGHSPVTLSSLRTFVLRSENMGSETMQRLQDFLVFLSPLEKLHLLLEGRFSAKIIEPVLKRHGSTLKSLIWEERSAPREGKLGDINTCNCHMNIIAKYCSQVEALGISVYWPAFSPTHGRNHCIARLAELQSLETLNIRNLPDLPPKSDWYSADMLYSGIATSLLKALLAKESRPASLRTLAFGASTYASSRLGVYHRAEHRLSDFLRLRVYQIDYLENLRSGQHVPTVTLIAKGVADNARGHCKNLDLFDVYWLDGFTREPQDSST